jgi:hypothetical protein
MRLPLVAPVRYCPDRNSGLWSGQKIERQKILLPSWCDATDMTTHDGQIVLDWLTPKKPTSINFARFRYWPPKTADNLHNCHVERKSQFDGRREYLCDCWRESILL